MNQTNDNKQQIIPDTTPQVNEIAAHIHRILELLGEDPQREGLVKTPMRYGFSPRAIGRTPTRSAIRQYSNMPGQR